MYHWHFIIHSAFYVVLCLCKSCDFLIYVQCTTFIKYLSDYYFVIFHIFFNFPLYHFFRNFSHCIIHSAFYVILCLYNACDFVICAQCKTFISFSARYFVIRLRNSLLRTNKIHYFVHVEKSTIINEYFLKKSYIFCSLFRNSSPFYGLIRFIILYMLIWLKNVP